jgi:hypothetical protein
MTSSKINSKTAPDLLMSNFAHAVINAYINFHGYVIYFRLLEITEANDLLISRTVTTVRTRRNFGTRS